MAELDSIVHEYGTLPRHTLAWLHGLGADGSDFEPVFEQLLGQRSIGWRVVLPHAPLRAVTINGGQRMRAWYDFLSMEFTRGESSDDIAQSVAMVMDLLREERARLGEGGKLILGGFSQGGVIALEAGLRAEARVDGVVAFSTYLWRDVPASQTRPPVFQAHGEHDPVIPLALGVAAHRALQAADVDSVFKTYPMGHSVCDAELADLDAWLWKQAY